MSREKIEEMAKVIKSSLDGLGSGNFNFTGAEISTMFAEHLYNASYRKQEWISVDERLPTETENDRGLVGIVNGYNGKIHFKDAIVLVDYDFSEKEWWSEDYDLTGCSVEYWTPLPEAPKMKGGE